MSGPDYEVPLAGPVTRLRARVADFRGRSIYQGYPDRYRCIFIHVPKTAGSSIAAALFGIASGHVPYFEYQRANPKKFERYFKFAFVRNPWDRLVSSFHFLRAGGLNEIDREWADRNLSAYSNFEDFVRNWLDPARIMSFPHFRPQAYYLANSDDALKVDFVGKFESLADDFDYIVRRLGRDARLPVSNKSEHAHFSTYYDRRTRDIVARIYARDIALFGYDLDV